MIKVVTDDRVLSTIEGRDAEVANLTMAIHAEEVISSGMQLVVATTAMRHLFKNLLKDFINQSTIRLVSEDALEKERGLDRK